MAEVGPLVEIALFFTSCIVLGAAVLHSKPGWINGLILLCVLTAVVVYSLLMDQNVLNMPFYLMDIVFQPSITRQCLLAFLVVNVLASIAFGMIVSLQGQSSTLHRKFFHLTVSLIYIAGLFLDKDFIWLSGYLSLCIFAILEVLRYHCVPPWGESLNNYLLVFKDGQDSSILLTPIYLLLGVFLPLFLSPNDTQPQLYHLAGVASVGVGDSLAAIVGTTMGKHHWPGKTKTVEGSAAMAIGVALFFVVAQSFFAVSEYSVFYCCLVAVILSATEAFLKNVDNIVLPILGYLLL